MRLGDLLHGEALPPDLRDLDLAGISADSREIQAGYAFFAVPGHAGDGLDYVGDAKTRGACVVVAPRLADCGLPVVVVEDVRAALARAAARFFPLQPKTIAAVTGTSGKTSVVAFLRQIWESQGLHAASIGTVGVVDSSGAHYGALTTPGPVELHRTLDELARRGVTHLAMEASSLGIEQRRLDGVSIAIGAFTNFSRDHLDLHPDMEAYFAAKMRLFHTLMRSNQTVVLDADGDMAARVSEVLRGRGLRIFSVGLGGRDITLLEARPRAQATSLRLRHDAVEYDLELPLAGAFQTSNALVAAGLAIASGAAPSEVFATFERLKGAPGRLELVGAKDGAAVFVDYAHKPDALAKVLATLRPLAKSRLIVVFGCGGDRDRGKRPLMGEIAAREADRVIVTDDNPRSEDAAKIRAEVLAGALEAGYRNAVEIGDRKQAIEAAVDCLDSGDVLIVAGKGHETGQIIGKTTLPFSDHAVIAAALAQASKRQGKEQTS